MRSISPRMFTFACVMLIWAFWTLAAETPVDAGAASASGIERNVDTVE